MKGIDADFPAIMVTCEDDAEARAILLPVKALGAVKAEILAAIAIIEANFMATIFLYLDYKDARH
jgi:uncharacterized protein with GYD domain